MLKFTVLFLVFLFANAKGSVQRIIGGNVVPNISEYPFVAALLTNGGQGNSYTQACGGSILTNRAILSAASCFYTNQVLNPADWWRVRVGSTTANSVGAVYRINLITVHDDYVAVTELNNLAILRSAIPITYNANVAPARIAGIAYPYADNQQVWALGWGITSSESSTHSEELRVVQMWLINRQRCQNSYSSHSISVTDNSVCAGLEDVGTRGQCAGDVGGPLLDSEGVVIGVFSATQDCGSAFYPSVNTRVASYTTWIVNTALAQ